MDGKHDHVEINDMIIYPGDDLLIDLSFYGIPTTATGTVLRITQKDCFHVKWKNQDVVALDIECEWKYVLSELVVRIVQGFAPLLPDIRDGNNKTSIKWKGSCVK